MFDIGSSLREARTRQGLDFPELEQLTKIRPKYLRALEDEQFEILPAPTYVRGFLRSYAEALGLDGQPFVDEYNSRFAVGDEDAPVRTRRVPQPRRDRAARESRMVVLALLGIAVVFALVIAAWRFGGTEPERVHGLNVQGQNPSVQSASTQGQARLVVRATGGNSWMEVRAGSASGRLLYSGTLEQGQRMQFEARALQLALAKPRERARAAQREPDGAPGRHGVRRHLEAHRPHLLLTRPRAAIVVTGSELVRGERQDRNGPFLAAEALRLGLEPERITIVGDRPEDLDRALEQGLGADICLVSGGLGPTHDDRTVERVAHVAGVGLVVDDELEREIGAVSQMVAERLRRPYAEFEPGVRKQATIPEGALSLGLAGTAPGLVLETDGAVVVVLPGPPRELQRLWERALDAAARAARAGARAGSRPQDAPLLRHAGVRRRRGARRGRRGRERRRGDDLRTRLRDPRRPRGGAERRGAGRRDRRDACARRSTGISSARTSGRSRRSCSDWHASAA